MAGAQVSPQGDQSAHETGQKPRFTVFTLAKLLAGNGGSFA